MLKVISPLNLVIQNISTLQYKLNRIPKPNKGTCVTQISSSSKTSIYILLLLYNTLIYFMHCIASMSNDINNI
jgi:hypothetical protein